MNELLRNGVRIIFHNFISLVKNNSDPISPQLRKKKALVIALVGLVIIYLDFSFIIRMQWRAITRINPQIAQVRNNLANFAKDITRMKELKARQAGLKEGILQKTKKVVASGQIPSVLENISILANNNNIKLLKMQPAYDQPLSSCLISLDLLCDYHSFGRFIGDLENAQVFFSVSDFKISRQESDLLQQKVSLVLKTYVKK